MAKGRLITRSVSKNRPVDMTLNLECSDEPLSEAQLAMSTKLKENYERVVSTLDDLMKEHSGQLLTQVGGVSAYQYKLSSNAVNSPSLIKANQLSVVNQTKSIKLNVLDTSNTVTPLTTTTTTPQGNMLVVDPRMGVLLGTVVSSQSLSAPLVTTSTAASTPAATTVSTASQKSLISTTESTTTPTNSRITTTSSGAITSVVTTPTTMRRAKVVPLQQLQEDPEIPALRLRNKTVTTSSTPTTTTPTASMNSQGIKINRSTTSSNSIVVSRPTEQTSIGGIRVGAKNGAGDVIEEAKKNLPDSKEIAFNKVNGTRTFPSLVVVARPHLSIKNITTAQATQERSELDMTVKSVLVYTPSKFAEWLIQKGLIRSEQFCTQHPTGVVDPAGNPSYKKLKLGMYSDSGTFPYSGGYVWIANCCHNKFVSVFSGSIFQGAPHPPSVLLKLIYHWSCQTNIQNVVSWVKVSNVYVKNFYTNLRSVCTAAIWDKSSLMGGKGSSIQVGVISLGTTSQDGNMRQVKVEVLGILNAETGQLRLRACDPMHDSDRSFRRRFNNILHPLENWVHKDSKILTDFTVDKPTLQDMGFSQVHQTAFSDQNPRNTRSNYQIMEYLRKIVPRMFQNTLSLLSRQMMQQFLDELVWRETFGSTAARAFDNIILHLAEQTKLCTSESLLDRLAKISTNPFQDWSYTVEPQPLPLPSVPEHLKVGLGGGKKENNRQSEPVQLKPGPKRKRKRQQDAGPEAKRPLLDFKLIQYRGIEHLKSDQIPLSEFYYATVDGDPHQVAKEDKSAVDFKCFLCNSVLKTNTQIMEHMICHVPPRVPGQTVVNDDDDENSSSNKNNRSSHVCRYCCAAFSSKHQMTTHIDEHHSVFGKSDDAAMVACGICEQKFSNTQLLINHMSFMHLPSEMPYRCDSCWYRTSSHKDIIDHFYEVHEKGETLQCPYCLKLIPLAKDGKISTSNVHAYLVHLQRHMVRREQGRGNKCTRCCLWFNQKSLLQRHQRTLHQVYHGSKDPNFHPFKHPMSDSDQSNIIVICKSQHQLRRIVVRSPSPELPEDDNIRKWSWGQVKIHLPNMGLRSYQPLACLECEEDVDEEQHFPGEQRCFQCRYVTCCWRAFKEHQQQIHNERPMTSLIVPSPLVNIPLEKKMNCSCGFGTIDGNLLASHLVKCRQTSPQATVKAVVETGEENKESPVMLDSLGLIPKSVP
ncbi:GSCOCG00002909001-RA-CDS [Cotesia congregata]|nr:GSCOCG00002909001-RA-CDS [Cotesia congregata]